MKKISIFSIITALCLILIVSAKPTYGLEAVASIKNLKGTVDIQRDNNIIAGRKGLILHDRDLVVTNKNSRVTLMFRDGSVIRLFPNTKFLIEKSVETKSGSRRFLNNFRLKLGSFWGKFTKKRQQTVIKTPTATCGIKGTTVAFTERAGNLSVSLSTGAVSLKNETEEIDLQSGELVENIGITGKISNKIRPLPYKVTIKADKQKIDLPQPGKEREIYFTLQLIDVKTNKNVARAGSVYISHEVDKISFDTDIHLNSRGYARIKAVVKPFENNDYKSGQAEIIAVMDGEEYMDIGAGHTVLTYDIPKQIKKKLKIDASTGNIQ